MRRVTVFWLLFAVTFAFYLLIVLWSLPRISAEAGGQVPFDLRPGGYGVEDAQAFLSALSDQGRRWYLGTQHALDWIYPGLLALTLGLGFTMLFRGPLRWVLLLAALGVAVFDWLENLAVARLLRADPATLDPAAVSAASLWTQAKTWDSTIAGLALLAGGTWVLVRRLRG